MATKKNAKRPEREKIREQQAYASMEMAIWEHQEVQNNKRVQVQSASVVVVHEQSTWSHTPLASGLASGLGQVVGGQESTSALAEPEQGASSSSATTPALGLSNTGQMGIAQYPHEWMARAATQSARDMSLFLLFMLLLFTLIGIAGS